MPATLRVGSPFFKNVLVSLGTNERLSNTDHSWLYFLSRQLSHFKLVVSPLQKTSVSSFEKRSFSRMIVVPSSSSSDLSTSFGRLPMRDVPRFTVPEDAVEHSGRAEQPDVSAVQGCERTPADFCLLREKHSRGLAIS